MLTSRALLSSGEEYLQHFNSSLGKNAFTDLPKKLFAQNWLISPSIYRIVFFTAACYLCCLTLY